MNAEPELLILYLITTYLQLKFFFCLVGFFVLFLVFGFWFFFQKLVNEQILSLKYELITSISWTIISVQLLH